MVISICKTHISKYLFLVLERLYLTPCIIKQSIYLEIKWEIMHN